MALTVPRLESFSIQWLHTLAITPLFLEQTFLVNMTTIFKGTWPYNTKANAKYYNGDAHMQLVKKTKIQV